MIELAGIVGPEPQRLPRRSPMPDRAEHLFASEHQLDGLADGAGGESAENLRCGDEAFATKAATEKRTANTNLLGRHSEQAGQAPLGPS